MGTFDYASVVRRCYECFNAGILDELSTLCAADAKVNHVCFGGAGTIGLRESYEMWSRAFPDGKVEITSLTAQGERVVVEYVGRGIQSGPLEGPMGTLPPSGKRCMLRLVDVVDCRNGKVAAVRCYWDAATLLEQIGASPALGHRAAERRPEASRPMARV